MEMSGFKMIFGEPVLAQNQSIEESVLTDDYVVDMVNNMYGVEDFNHSTIDYDVLKLAPETTYTDLLPVGPQYQEIGHAPSVFNTDEGSSSVPSPSVSESVFSPVPSPYSPTLLPLETSSDFLQSSIEDCITLVVSPSEVVSEPNKAPTGKKRGRKPKAEKALHEIQNTKKMKKTKVYEITQPFTDMQLERKRLNAVNAKRHRDLQKQVKENLEKQLQDVKTERDHLKDVVETLRAREAELSLKLEQFKNYIKNQQNSALALLRGTSTP
ncbi:hypothetical protein SK128_016806 [Halocaridina rubra]|uniref:BZIP domain-containing protein n=1 Tax=Halocaridina rubra TaxID=373956 RepID=A0AAN8X5P3_HALRR